MILPIVGVGGVTCGGPPPSERESSACSTSGGSGERAARTSRIFHSKPSWATRAKASSRMDTNWSVVFAFVLATGGGGAGRGGAAL